MNLLVTGGAGFIGSNLVHLLVQQEHTVLNLDKLTYAGNLHSLADLATNQRHRFVRADITDVTAVRDAFASFQPEAVLHLAAESHVDRSIDGPATFVQTNLVGTYVLLQCALDYFKTLPPPRRERFRFLHVSTDEVFGSLGPTGLFNENSGYDPHSPYSATKAGSDHLARAWFYTFGLPVLVTNCSNNYGPCQFPEKLIPMVILRALRGDSIPVYGPGLNVRDWLYVGDHAEALLTLVLKGQPGQSYNIGGNNEQRNIDLVRLLCSLLDELRPRSDGRRYADQITLVPDRPGHDLRYAIDSSKIRRELGWVPRHDQNSGFRRTVQWYLDNQPWWQRILSGDYHLQRLGTVSG
jgi:dTDP-glucose 4,6-dehydratase